jgi:hypothetical protein
MRPQACSGENQHDYGISPAGFSLPEGAEKAANWADLFEGLESRATEDKKKRK